MEISGVVQNGMIILDNPSDLADGTRVRIVTVAVPSEEATPATTIGERLAKYAGAAKGLPADMAAQHEHYRLGTPKR